MSDAGREGAANTQRPVTYQCECCQEWLSEAEHPFDDEGWCKDCAQAAKDTFDYRAWVNRGG